MAKRVFLFQMYAYKYKHVYLIFLVFFRELVIFSSRYYCSTIAVLILRWRSTVFFQVSNYLTTQKLFQLAQQMTTKHMRTLAIKYLDFDSPAVDNVESSRPGDPSAFKLDIFQNWMCRNGNNGKVTICRF